MADRHWKVTVSSLFPNDDRVISIYEGHHADEAMARDAALTKTAINNGGSTIDRVEKVKEIGYRQSGRGPLACTYSAGHSPRVLKEPD